MVFPYDFVDEENRHPTAGSQANKVMAKRNDAKRSRAKKVTPKEIHDGCMKSVPKEHDCLH